MLDRSSSDPFDGPVPDISRQFPPLPAWLSTRLLRRDETVARVYGPRFNPTWERYITHPALLLVALALSAFCWACSWPMVETSAERIALAVLALVGIGFPSLIVLGIANGYFTRLVVTNDRLLILQGYEVCRSWDVNRLPRSLVRYRRMGGGEERPSVDLDALKTMIGGSSDKIVGAKGILAFGKQLDRIQNREDDRP